MMRKILVLLVRIAYKLGSNMLIKLTELMFLYNTKLFDADFYVGQRWDIQSYRYPLLLHFIRYGYKEGISPFPLFNTKYYIYWNRDVRYNPLVHYLIYGEKEKRWPHPIFDRFFYENYYNIDNVNGGTYLEHYINYGSKLGYMPNSIFAENTSDKLYFFSNSLSCIINNSKCFEEIRKCLKNREFEKFAAIFEMSYIYSGDSTKSMHVNIGCSADYADKRIDIQEGNDAIEFDGLNYLHAYLSFYTNVKIIGGTKFVLKDENLINDEIYEFRSRDYGAKAWQYFEMHPKNDNLGLLKNVKVDYKNKIHKGILISSDHDLNYFHWMIECLPMIECVTKSHLCDGYPLIIESGLQPNLKSALEKLVENKREIVEIDSGDVYEIDDLIVPIGLSRVLDRHNENPDLVNDVVLNPFWIGKVRNKLRKICSEQPYRKLYLTRRSETYRKLLNEEEIELELLKNGFEIIDLEKVSFEFQAELFSQASIVVAPTGATVTNILLMPDKSCLLALFSNSEIVETQILHGFDAGTWSQLARICGVKYKQFSGEIISVTDDMQVNYWFDTDMLLTEIRTLENEK